MGEMRRGWKLERHLDPSVILLFFPISTSGSLTKLKMVPNPSGRANSTAQQLETLVSASRNALAIYQQGVSQAGTPLAQVAGEFQIRFERVSPCGRISLLGRVSLWKRSKRMPSRDLDEILQRWNYSRLGVSHLSSSTVVASGASQTGLCRICKHAKSSSLR